MLKDPKGSFWYSNAMTDRQFLSQAIALAQQSPEPVGCGVVIVSDGKVVAESYNSQRKDNIAVNHAEMKAVVLANRRQKTRELKNATAYCSCEPCAMCLVAFSYAKVPRIVYHKTMHDLFPQDPQAQLDSRSFVSTLNFVPKLEQLVP